MSHARVRRVAVNLRSFERAIQDGALAREGARVDNHTCTLREARRIRAGGRTRPYGGEDIAPGDTVERTWACTKPGFQRSLGLDTFDYREVFTKRSPDCMAVTDQVIWHGGASRARRAYEVAACGRNAIDVSMQPWQVRLGGMRGKLRWLRGGLERTMRGQFPKQVDGPLLAAVSRLGTSRYAVPEAGARASALGWWVGFENVSVRS